MRDHVTGWRTGLCAALGLTALLAGGCGGGDQQTFAVETGEDVRSPQLRPLYVPPVIDVRPGAPEPIEEAGAGGFDPSVSQGESALLATAGAGEADPAIRGRVGDDRSIAVLPPAALQDLLATAGGTVGPGILIRRR